jgi:hypothetical protein
MTCDARGGGLDFGQRDHAGAESISFSGRIGAVTDRLERRFWLLALAQAAHSIEEMLAGLYDFFWIDTGRLHEAIPAFPQFRWTPTRFAVVNMGIIALLFGAVPFVRERRPGAIALAWVAAVVEVLNGTGPLAGTVNFSGYVPGALTAPFPIETGLLVSRELRSATIRRETR